MSASLALRAGVAPEACIRLYRRVSAWQDCLGSEIMKPGGSAHNISCMLGKFPLLRTFVVSLYECA
jgi:hypothetical protein